MPLFKDEEEKKVIRTVIGAAMLHALIGAKYLMDDGQLVKRAVQIADEFIKQVDV